VQDRRIVVVYRPFFSTSSNGQKLRPLATNFRYNFVVRHCGPGVGSNRTFMTNKAMACA
jgi:hypothetical protein